MLCQGFVLWATHVGVPAVHRSHLGVVAVKQLASRLVDDADDVYSMAGEVGHLDGLQHVAHDLRLIGEQHLVGCCLGCEFKGVVHD